MHKVYHFRISWHTGFLSSFSATRLPYYLTFLAILTALCSNSACNVLIGAATGSLLFYRFRFGHPLLFPPVKAPLALFLLATIVSIALSGHILAGWPGVRKFYLYLILLLVASTFRELGDVRRLVVALCGVMSLSALWSFYQFWQKVEQARILGRNSYEYRIEERITGFMSHWMTLSGEEMIVILTVLSLLFFAGELRRRGWILAGLAIILFSLLLGYTRSVWLGCALGCLYLVWIWNRRFLLLAPVPILALLWLDPAYLGERLRSTVQPHGDTDSNRFRLFCRRTGWEMIKAHPWFGLGPEQVNAQFKSFIPAELGQPPANGWYGHLHNVYLQYAAERGIPGLIAFLWFLGKMLFDFIRALGRTPREDRERRWILHGCIAVMLGVLAAAFYEHNLGDGEVLTLFLAICACGYRAVGAYQPFSGICSF